MFVNNIVRDHFIMSLFVPSFEQMLLPASVSYSARNFREGIISCISFVSPRDPIKFYGTNQVLNKYLCYSGFYCSVSHCTYLKEFWSQTVTNLFLFYQFCLCQSLFIVCLYNFYSLSFQARTFISPEVVMNIMIGKYSSIEKKTMKQMKAMICIKHRY